MLSRRLPSSGGCRRNRAPAAAASPRWAPGPAQHLLPHTSGKREKLQLDAAGCSTMMGGQAGMTPLPPGGFSLCLCVWIHSSSSALRQVRTVPATKRHRCHLHGTLRGQHLGSPSAEFRSAWGQRVALEDGHPTTLGHLPTSTPSLMAPPQPLHSPPTAPQHSAWALQSDFPSGYRAAPGLGSIEPTESPSQSARKQLALAQGWEIRVGWGSAPPQPASSPRGLGLLRPRKS